MEAFQQLQLANRSRAASSRRIQNSHQGWSCLSWHQILRSSNNPQTASLEQSRSAYTVETYAALQAPVSQTNYRQLANHDFQGLQEDPSVYLLMILHYKPSLFEIPVGKDLLTVLEWELLPEGPSISRSFPGLPVKVTFKHAYPIWMCEL